MDASKISIIQLMKAKMSYQSERQGVLAQNIAHMDTPGYRARELEPFAFEKAVEAEANKLEMRATDPRHMHTFPSEDLKFRVQNSKSTFETSPQGNNVVLEEQMAAAAENKLSYEETTSLYRKMMSMMATAVRGSR